MSLHGEKKTHTLRNKLQWGEKAPHTLKKKIEGRGFPGSGASAYFCFPPGTHEHVACSGLAYLKVLCLKYSQGWKQNIIQFHLTVPLIHITVFNVHITIRVNCSSSSHFSLIISTNWLSKNANVWSKVFRVFTTLIYRNTI